MICALLPALSAATDLDKTVQAGPAHLTLTVDNIKKPKGVIRAGLYSGEADYVSGQRHSGVQTEVSEVQVVMVFENIPVGEYGLKIIHDIDADGKMDTGLFGLPTEPFAFSNSARGFMGPATWKQAKFTVVSGDNHHIITFK